MGNNFKSFQKKYEYARSNIGKYMCWVERLDHNLHLVNLDYKGKRQRLQTLTSPPTDIVCVVGVEGDYPLIYYRILFFVRGKELRIAWADMDRFRCCPSL